MKIILDIWEGKPAEDELQFEMERIGKLIADGYREGEIFSQSGGARNRGYGGWWKKEVKS